MNVLLVSPHPDDAEICCGGTVTNLKSANNTIWSLYFAPCTEDPLNLGHLEQHRTVVKLLHIDKLIEHDFPRDVLENYKQDIRNILWEIKNTFNPQIVFCPTLNDLHQDHRAVAECCLTIFRNSLILGYGSIASCPNFSPNFFVKLNKKHVKTKIKAIKHYKSQLEHRSSYFRTDALLSQMKVYGASIRTMWSEAFEFVWCGGKWLTF